MKIVITFVAMVIMLLGAGGCATTNRLFEGKAAMPTGDVPVSNQVIRVRMFFSIQEGAQTQYTMLWCPIEEGTNGIARVAESKVNRFYPDLRGKIESTFVVGENDTHSYYVKPVKGDEYIQALKVWQETKLKMKVLEAHTPE